MRVGFLHCWTDGDDGDDGDSLIKGDSEGLSEDLICRDLQFQRKKGNRLGRCVS